MMSELTIESYKRDNWKREDKKIKKERNLKHYFQWYWDNDWLGNKYKAFYHGPRLKWMKLYKERKKWKKK